MRVIRSNNYRKAEVGNTVITYFVLTKGLQLYMCIMTVYS